MDIENARSLIRKINSLFGNFDQENKPPTLIERDLMLSYLQQLYAVFLEGKNTLPEQKPAALHTLPSEPHFTPAPPKIEIKPEPIPAPPILPPQPEPRKNIPLSQDALDKLFEFNKPTDLAERLGETPVQDLAMAMSINDRLLYVNELFGRDQSALKDSLTILNRYDSFPAAKNFLMSLAEQYQWVREERTEIARNFIKLVKRRYPA
jgi:hypothetical protein